MYEDLMELQQSVYKLLQVTDSSRAIIVSEFVYNTNIMSVPC